MTVAIYGRSIEPEFFPYLKRLVEGLERKGVGMVCEEKFAALLSGNYGYEPKFLNCFGRCTLIKEEVELLLSVGEGESVVVGGRCVIEKRELV